MDNKPLASSGHSPAEIKEKESEVGDGRGSARKCTKINGQRDVGPHGS